jgi:hypothetical protein
LGEPERLRARFLHDRHVAADEGDDP